MVNATRISCRLLCTSALVLLVTGCSKAPSEDASPSPAPPPSDASSAAPIEVEDLAVPSGPGAMAPNLALTSSGVQLTWLEPTADAQGHTLFTSSLDGNSWTTPQTIATGDDFFANWADLPALAEAPDGRRYAHWLRKLGGDTYAYGVAVASYGGSDESATWQTQGLLHDDASPTEHGFVSYAVDSTGGLRAFWLDGRAMADGGSMQLRTTTLGGWEADAPPSSELLDDRVCECCSTDAASTNEGTVVVYRDRSADEIRDIAVVRQTADGWSEPTILHDDGWQIQGCPVNGPAIAAEADRVAAAWFTAAKGLGKVQLAFSLDNGRTFDQPIAIDVEKPLGRLDLVLDNQGRAIISWLATQGDTAEIRWQRIAADGTMDTPRVVAPTSNQRSAGVPRMVLDGEHLIFAWVEDAEPSRLRSQRVLP